MMNKEPASIVGAIVAIIGAVIAFLTDVNDFLIVLAPLVQALATRQVVYSPDSYAKKGA